jgi:hypothetical protein
LEQHLTGRGRSQPPPLYAQSRMCPKVMMISRLVTPNAAPWQACTRACGKNGKLRTRVRCLDPEELE